MARPVGSLIPGGLGAWFAQAKPGDTYWTAQPMNGLVSVAKRHGRTIVCKQFYAVANDLVTARLVRIEVLS